MPTQSVLTPIERIFFRTERSVPNKNNGLDARGEVGREEWTVDPAKSWKRLKNNLR